MKKSRDVRICPKCGSIKAIPAELDFSGLAVGLAGGVSPKGIFQCGDCGNKGIFPVVDENEVASIQKEFKKQKPKRD